MKLSILIVDDNDADRYLVKRILDETGHEIHFYEEADGKAAIEFLENYEENYEANPDKFPPVIIFLDINMPLMDGFEFLEKFSTFRSVLNYESSAVLMFSSSTREEDKERAMAYDFVKGFVTKMPEDTDELIKLIEQIIV